MFRDEFLPGRGTAIGYAGGLLVLTLVMTGLYLLQERGPRPTRLAPSTTTPPDRGRDDVAGGVLVDVLADAPEATTVRPPG